MRPLRFVPHRKTLVEVTTRTIHSRLLLRPSLSLNEIFLGVLGRAQALYGVGIVAVTCLSGHYHALLLVDSAEQLSSFMTYLNSNLAREAGRLAKWRDKFWSRRYRGIVISEEEGAQVERLKYVLGHGVKEGLVEKACQWPGVHCVKALLDGLPLVGQWFNRTKESAARQRGKEFGRLEFATAYAVELSPLPCWEHLSPEQRRERIAALVGECDAEAAERRAKTGKAPLGALAVQQQSPHSQPMTTKRSPAPLFHAATKRVRDELYGAYYGFLAAFREASGKWLSGDLGALALFPEGCFPPAPRFVAA